MNKKDINKDQYNWDLESILEGKTIEEWFNDWLLQKNKILSIFPDFYISEDNFINWKQENLKFSKLSNVILNYISNNLNEDVNNDKWISWSQKLNNEMNDLSEKTSNSSNLLIKNKNKILSYLKNPILSDYVREYNVFFKQASHILSDKEEKILAKKDIIDDNIETVFSTLTDGTIKYDDVYNSSNKKIKIKSAADFSYLLKSKDLKLRKSSWYSFNNAYFKYKDLLSQLLYSNYQMLNINAKISKYDDYIDECCKADEIDRKFILSLYKNVERFKPLFQKYSKLRNSFIKQKYNLKNVEPWDKNLEISSSNKLYSIEEIQSIILNAFSIMGNEYISIVKKAFEEKWISWLPKPNKQTGAYSIGGVFGLKKYFISMNFDKTIQSLYTAAHELGHSLHSYYFVKNQKVNASCEIFYAEIASITNEILLSYYLLDKEKNDLNKLKILDEIISNFFATTSRQIVFSNFEYDFVDKLNNNESITYETIKKLFYENSFKYLNTSKSKFYDKKYEASQSTILRISHFYVGNFYVYKYAVGQIAAMICASKIFRNENNFLNDYFNFLKSGSSLSPIDTIKLLKIDFEDESTINQCYKSMEDLINLYKNIIQKNK